MRLLRRTPAQSNECARRTNTFFAGEIVSGLRRKTPAKVAKIRPQEKFANLRNNLEAASVES